jgi:phage baseplate assembly protein V
MSAARRIFQRVAGLLARIRITSSDSGSKCQLVSGADAGEPFSVEAVEPYGLTVTPLPGAEAVLASPGGDTAAGVVIQIGDRRFRPTGLPLGDVCVYDHRGNRVWLRASGITIVCAAGPLTVQQLPGGPDLGALGQMVHGAGIDPFTGVSYAALGNTTALVRAEKV